MKSILIIIALVFSFLSSTAQWAQTAKLTSNDRNMSDVFGYSLSAGDSILVVGAPMQDLDSNAQNTVADAGAVYIFTKDNTGKWQENQKICASNRQVADYFGDDVAFDANTIIVGADETDINNFLQNAGSAYIFEKGANNKFVQTQIIEASDRKANASFGRAVDLSGAYAIVGSPEDYTDSLNMPTVYKAGSAYIFEKNTNGVWTQVQKLSAPDADTNKYFGFSVSIDNNTAVVGAVYDRQNSQGFGTLTAAGAAYIYERSAIGRWNFKQKIVNADRDSFDLFAKYVSVLGDYIFISSENKKDSLGNNPLQGAGSVYVFKKNTSGEFVQWQKLCAPDRPLAIGFGSSIDFNNQYAIIGAEYVHGPYYGNQIGAAYVYKKSSNGKWYFEQKLFANEDEADDFFGKTVAINDKTMFISSLNGYDAAGGSYKHLAGAVYVIEDDYVGMAPIENMDIEYGPNPSHGYFEIKLPKEQHFIHVEVYNMLGQIVFEQDYYDRKRLNLDLNLPKGLYIVNLQDKHSDLARIKLNIY